MKITFLSTIFTHYGKTKANDPLIVDKHIWIMNIQNYIVHNRIMDIYD